MFDQNISKMKKFKLKFSFKLTIDMDKELKNQNNFLGSMVLFENFLKSLFLSFLYLGI